MTSATEFVTIRPHPSGKAERESHPLEFSDHAFGGFKPAAW